MISLPDSLDNFSWERQPGEDKTDFEWFEIYRDMGPVRTQSGVARVLDVSRATVAERSSKNRWVDRAKAFDRWVERQTTRGMRYAATERERIRLAVFKKAIGASEQAVDVLVGIMTAGEKDADRVRAASKILDVVGYDPPATPDEVNATIDPVVKAKMLDALSPAERVALQELTAKMRRAAEDHEKAHEAAKRYPGLVPGAGLEAANAARLSKTKGDK